MTGSKFAFTGVVFFGRSVGEYVSMFNLDLEALRGKRILDCCAGPAAFACQVAPLGVEVTACDLMYDQEPALLRRMVVEHAVEVSAKQEKFRQQLHEALVPTSERLKAMKVFLDDFEKPESKGRYVPCRLPELPFADQEFDQVLCANLLFLYSDLEFGGMMHDSPFDLEFHRRSLAELMRVTKTDLRLYPLQGPAVTEHAWLRPLMAEMQATGFGAEIVDVAQRDIIGAEKMLRIFRQ